MSINNHIDWIKKLTVLLGVAGVSALLSVPADGQIKPDYNTSNNLNEYSAEYIIAPQNSQKLNQFDHAFSNFGQPCTTCGEFYTTPNLRFGSAIASTDSGEPDRHPRADGGSGMDHRQILVDLLIPSDANNVKQEIKSDSTIASQLKFLNGTWEGTYMCSQGLTNLRLEIVAKSTTDIDTVFYFSAPSSNPSVSSGSFRMKGIYQVFNSPKIPNLLELKATSWINQPNGYFTVDLLGNVFPDEKRITGQVKSNISGCSRFDVVKTDKK